MNIKDSRKLKLNIIYAGKNITKDIKESLSSCSQSDSVDELDSLELSLENRDLIWLNAWIPKKGETLSTSLILENWENENKKIQHNSGKFYIDTVDFSGPPDVVNIKAISHNLSTDIVDKKENRVWENVNFSTILTEISKNRGLRLICDINFNRKYLRLEQKLQSDFDFLKNLCKEAGLKLKLYDDKIVVFEEEIYEKKEPKKIFFKNQIASYSFSTEDTDCYESCTISYYNYKKKKKIEKTFRIKDKNRNKKNKRNLFINEDKHIHGKNQQEINKQLAEIAKKALRDKNKKETRGNITFMGTENLLSTGDTILIDGFGKFSGKYFIDNLRIEYVPYRITAAIHKVMNLEVKDD